MAAYNPPFYVRGMDPLTLTLNPAQLPEDMDGPLVTNGRVATNEYYAPDAWCETYTDMTAGDKLYRLKPGFLTPDGLLRHRLGYHSTAPDPTQLDPVDLASFRVIQPHAHDGVNSTTKVTPLWYDTLELSGGPGAQVPELWRGSSTETDRLNGWTYYYLKDGYLTPGLIDLIERNSVETITPPVPLQDGRTYTLPATDGVAWIVGGIVTEPGTYTVPPSAETVTVTITVDALPGYTFDPPATETVFVFDAGAPPDPPEDTGETEAVALMRRLLGDESSDDEMGAAFHMVRLFVFEYTRGKGFKAGKPTPGLLAVIAAGSVRLVTNPEQAELYVLDGITIRPAVFNGYTLAEQSVLNRYRRRFA